MRAFFVGVVVLLPFLGVGSPAQRPKDARPTGPDAKRQELCEAVRQHDVVRFAALAEHMSPRELDWLWEVAIERDDVAVVRLLLRNGANPNFGIDGPAETPLISAARLGCWEIAALLLEAGANPNGRSGFNRGVWFPLYFAVRHGHASVVHQLLGAKADVNARLGGGVPGLESRETPLMVAASRGDIKMMDHLIERGADPNLTAADGRTARDYLKEHIAAASRLADRLAPRR